MSVDIFLVAILLSSQADLCGSPVARLVSCNKSCAGSDRGAKIEDKEWHRNNDFLKIKYFHGDIFQMPGGIFHLISDPLRLNRLWFYFVDPNGNVKR